MRSTMAETLDLGNCGVVRCRVAVKTGKVCAIKTGMGLEDGNMQ
jgi:hypothetical protein